MSDPLDTLRNDIAQVVEAHLIDTYGYEAMRHVGKGDLDMEADAVLAFLVAASGEQRRALLGLLGYEVREGVFGENEAGHWDVFPRNGWPDGSFRDANCLVLRDQGKTTDV